MFASGLLPRRVRSSSYFPWLTIAGWGTNLQGKSNEIDNWQDLLFESSWTVTTPHVQSENGNKNGSHGFTHLMCKWTHWESWTGDIKRCHCTDLEHRDLKGNARFQKSEGKYKRSNLQSVCWTQNKSGGGGGDPNWDQRGIFARKVIRVSAPQNQRSFQGSGGSYLSQTRPADPLWRVFFFYKSYQSPQDCVAKTPPFRAILCETITLESIKFALNFLLKWYRIQWCWKRIRHSDLGAQNEFWFWFFNQWMKTESTYLAARIRWLKNLC